MKNKIIIIQTIILVILLFTTFSLKNDIDRLNQNQQNFNYQIQNISSDINNINRLTYEKNQKEKIVQFQDFRVENVDGRYEDANVQATIRFKEIKNDATVYLEYRPSYHDDSDIYMIRDDQDIQWEKPEEQFGEWKQVELNKLSGTEYGCDFEASYQFDYETRVLIETDDVTKNEETNKIYLYSNSKPAYDLDIQPLEMSSDGHMKYEIRLMQNQFDNKINIVEVNCEVFNNDTKLEEYNLMDDKNLEHKNDDMSIWSVERKVEFTATNGENFDSGLRIEVTITDEFGKEYKKIWKSM